MTNALVVKKLQIKLHGVTGSCILRLLSIYLTTFYLRCKLHILITNLKNAACGYDVLETKIREDSQSFN